ncbi:MAG: hypothetical protein CR991_10280 [Proteobacteria bacterium]|nr:MAG: hypothetical protein CR991_10280 [Pseudomonadota bacterium]
MHLIELQKRIAATETDQQELQVHYAYLQRLLKVCMWLTFLLYLAFAISLYLGDVFHLQSLLATFVGSWLGGGLYVVICILLAYVLSGAKHAAYTHFSLFKTALVVVAVTVSMGLLAEVFQSSANQVAKAKVLTESSAEYRTLVNQNPAVGVKLNASLTIAIADAQQRLARCEEKLKIGKEKHCEGDRARLAALQNSEQTEINAQIQAATANQDKRFARLDQLKDEGYNPVIRAVSALFVITMASAISLLMFIVASFFEAAHYHLSVMLRDTRNALLGTRQQLNRLQTDYQQLAGQPYRAADPASPVPAKDNPLPPELEKPNFGFTPAASGRDTGGTFAESTVKPALFKYQQQMPNLAPTDYLGFIGFVDPNRPTPRPTEEKPLDLTRLTDFRARGGGWHGPAPDPEQMCHPDPERPCAQGVQGQCPSVKTARINVPAERTAGLFREWVQAVESGEIKPTVTDSRIWVQRKIAGNQREEKTPTLAEIGKTVISYFTRADRQLTCRIKQRKNWRNGQRNKYILLPEKIK